MNTRELAEQLSQEHGLSKVKAREMLDSIFTKVGEALAGGDEVSVPGFGKFKVRSSEAREGRNPRTGQPMAIAASKKVAFSVAKALKDRL